MPGRVAPEGCFSQLDVFRPRFAAAQRKHTLRSRLKTFLQGVVRRAPKFTLDGGVLGVGGHAQVISGTLNNKKVAVKILPSASNSSNRETRVSRSLPPHPNVVAAVSAVTSRSGRFIYLALELCDCDVLAKFVERGHATPTDVLEVFRDVAAGLAHLHANGVYHLDIKPDNILLSNGVAKLCDLGHR